MKAGFLLGSLSREAGGLFDATRHLGQALHAPPVMDVEVFGLADSHAEADAQAWKPLCVHTLSAHTYASSWGLAPGMRAVLDGAALDLLHVHGLWMYQSVASLAWKRGNSGRLIISPHGMLDPWALANSRWKKRLAGWAFENAHLRAASCLHALCEAELRSIRAYGLTAPVCVIPNAVEIPSGPFASPLWAQSVPEAAKVLLYLGRLHPKKGLAQLLEAWKLLRSRQKTAEDWRLVIAGWDEGNYRHELEAIVHEFALSGVHFVGPQFGADKQNTYARAQAFVLPSFSEGLPMVVLEAWAHGLPVVLTPACNLPQGAAAGAAVETRAQPHAIACALDEIVTASPDALADMGQRGKRLVAARFAWPQVAHDMQSVYEWMMGGGSPPACLVTD